MVIACTNCGAALHPEAGEALARCSYCGAETRVKDAATVAVERGIAPSAAAAPDAQALWMALGVGAADLAHNVNGKLSQAQIAKIEAWDDQDRTMAGCLGVPLGIGGALGILMAVAGPWSAQAQSGRLVVGLGSLAMVAVAGVVLFVKTPLLREVATVEGLAAFRPAGEKSSKMLLHVGGVDFEIPDAVLDCVRPGDRYIVYFVKDSTGVTRHLLSMQWCPG